MIKLAIAALIALSLLLTGAGYVGNRIGTAIGERLTPGAREAQEWAKFNQLGHDEQDAAEANQR